VGLIRARGARHRIGPRRTKNRFDAVENVFSVRRALWGRDLSALNLSNVETNLRYPLWDGDSSKVGSSFHSELVVVALV
jgi:hypothetical protein